MSREEEEEFRVQSSVFRSCPELVEGFEEEKTFNVQGSTFNVVIARSGEGDEDDVAISGASPGSLHSNHGPR